MTAIERIDAEIATLEARIEGLRYARGIVAGEPVPAAPQPRSPAAVTPAKKSTPPVAESRPEAVKSPATANRHAANREMRRAVIARHLSKGTATFGELELATGTQAVTLRMDLDCPYFMKTDPSNRRSPWTLTESGRKLAESSGPG